MFNLRPLTNGLSLRQPSTLIATWFGSGLIRPASGTWGSLASLPFVAAIFFLPAHMIAAVLCAFILISFAVGLWASARYMKTAQKHDASEIVIDETCGLAISFLPFLMYNEINNLSFLVSIAVIFGLFRFYDAAKPYPISYLDKNVGGAMGVMIDDVLAGICAGLTYIGGMILWAHLV